MNNSETNTETIVSIHAALEAGIRGLNGGDTSPLFDALVMLEDVAEARRPH